MLTPGDDKINKAQPEYAEILLFLRKHLLSYNENMAETFKYMTIFYEYRGKGICYVHLKDDYVYLGFTGDIKHPKLHREGRKTVQVFKCYVNKDIDIRSLNSILKSACAQINKKLKLKGRANKRA